MGELSELRIPARYNWFEARQKLERAAEKHVADDRGISPGDEALFSQIRNIEHVTAMLASSVAHFRALHEVGAPEAVIDLARCDLRKHLHEMAWSTAYAFSRMNEAGVMEPDEDWEDEE